MNTIRVSNSLDPHQDQHSFVLKILSGNEIMTNGQNDGQPKSSSHLFQSGAIMSTLKIPSFYERQKCYLLYSFLDHFWYKSPVILACCGFLSSADNLSTAWTQIWGKFNNASVHGRSLFWYPSLFSMCKAWHQYNASSRLLASLNSPLDYQFWTGSKPSD